MSLVGWWRLDGNLRDSGPNKLHGIEYGDLTWDSTTDDSVLGTSASFGSDYVTINNVPPYLSNNRSYSVFCWIKKASPATNPIICIHDSTGADDVMGFWTKATTGKLDMYINNVGYKGEGTTNVCDGDWHCVGYVFDVNQSEVRMYVDGNLDKTYSSESTTGITSTDIMQIGADAESGPVFSTYLTAHLNDVRIYDRVLSLREIKELSRCKIFHARCDYDTFESSTDYDTINPTIVNSPGDSLYNTTDHKTGIGCVDFSSTSTTYIDYGNPHILRFNTNCTICFRINLNNFPGTFAFVIAKAISGEGTIRCLPTGAVTLHWGNDGSNGGSDSSSSSSNGAITTGTWISIAVVRSEQDETCHWYKNGQFLNSDITSWGSAVRGDRNFYLGYETDLTSFPTVDGLLDDIRIYNSSLSADDIMGIHRTPAQLDDRGNFWC